MTRPSRASKYAALGNPHRLSIALVLAKKRDATPTELLGTIKLSQPAMSQHLKVLHEAGIVTRKRDSREILYSLTPLAHSMLNVTN